MKVPILPGNPHAAARDISGRRGPAISVSLTPSGQVWSLRQPVPGGGRDGAVSFVIGSKIYLGGGAGMFDFYEYDPSSGTWTKKANIPGVTTERPFACGFSVGEKGYVALGADKARNQKKDIREYDPATDTWKHKTDFPAHGRNGAACFVIGSKAYIGDGTDGQNYYSDFYEYDPVADRWTQRGTLPMGAVCFPTAFSIGEYGYVTPGLGYDGEFGDIYRYDPSSGACEKKRGLVSGGGGRLAAVGFAIGGFGYIGLGEKGITIAYKDFLQYDPVANTVKKMADYPGGTGRGWATACATATTGYIGTGWDLESNFTDEWMSFSPAAAGIDDASGRTVSIRPNPSGNSIIVQLPHGLQSGRIAILDGLGRRVVTEEIGEGMGVATLDLSELPAGLYLVEIDSPSGRSVAKIIKR